MLIADSSDGEHAGVGIRDVLLVLPAMLRGLLHPVALPLLLQLHQGLGVQMRALRHPLWQGEAVRAPLAAVHLPLLRLPCDSRGLDG